MTRTAKHCHFLCRGDDHGGPLSRAESFTGLGVSENSRKNNGTQIRNVSQNLTWTNNPFTPVDSSIFLFFAWRGTRGTNVRPYKQITMYSNYGVLLLRVISDLKLIKTFGTVMYKFSLSGKSITDSCVGQNKKKTNLLFFGFLIRKPRPGR